MTAIDRLADGWAAIEAAIGCPAEIPPDAKTVKEIAERYRLSLTTAQRMVNDGVESGKLRRAKLGKNSYYWAAENEKSKPMALDSQRGRSGNAHRSVARAPGGNAA